MMQIPYQDILQIQTLYEDIDEHYYSIPKICIRAICKYHFKKILKVLTKSQKKGTTIRGIDFIEFSCFALVIPMNYVVDNGIVIKRVLDRYMITLENDEVIINIDINGNYSDMFYITIEEKDYKYQSVREELAFVDTNTNAGKIIYTKIIQVIMQYLGGITNDKKDKRI